MKTLVALLCLFAIPVISLADDSADLPLRPASEAAIVRPVAAPSRTPAATAPVPVLSATYPGVGTTPGYVRPNKAVVLHIGSDMAETVYISNRFPSHIVTPYPNPQVIDQSKSDYVTNGSDIFLTPHGDEPIAIWVGGDQPGDKMISLVLIPKPIPPQNIILQLDVDGSANSTNSAEKSTSNDDPAPDSYIDQIRVYMRAVALNKPLPGFTEGNLPASEGVMGPLRVIPLKRFSGTKLDLWEYTLINISNQDVEINESSFWHQGVRAVSEWPRVKLAPGEKTVLLVLADKEAMETAPAMEGATHE